MLTILCDNTLWVKCGFGDPTEALLLAVPAVCWPEGLLYLKELVKLRLSMKLVTCQRLQEVAETELQPRSQCNIPLCFSK